MPRKQTVPYTWYAEYIPSTEDFLHIRTKRVWFLAARDNRGGRLAKKVSYRSEEAARQAAQALVEGQPDRELVVVVCDVTWGLMAMPRLQFKYEPGGVDWTRAQAQFEQFWRRNRRQLADSIFRYGGEFTAMMDIGRAAWEDDETEGIQASHVIAIMRADGREEAHPVGPVGQMQLLQRDCRDKVMAHLFHQAVEVGMKTLLRTDGWDQARLKSLGHRLGDVWSALDKRHRGEVNHIFNEKLKDEPPVSVSFNELVDAYSRGQQGQGVTGDLRYLGEDEWKPLPDRTLISDLWKMATALHFYYSRHVVLEASVILAALQGKRKVVGRG